MSTSRSLLATRLLALLAGTSVLTIAIGMARLVTAMEAALESSPADDATARISTEARLVLQRLLPTHASLRDQERAFWTRLVIGVTVVRHRRVDATGAESLALMPTWRRTSAARKRRMKDGSAAMAADLIEDGVRAGSTSAAMTELLAGVLCVAATQRSTTSSQADVLSFEAFLGTSRRD